VFRKIATFAVGIVLCGTGSICAQGKPQFTVMVYNEAGVDHSSLNRAQDIVEKIYQQAGVAIQWRDCTHASRTGSQVCLWNQQKTAFSVKIVRRALNLPGEDFGVAFVGEDGLGQQADVFYSGIERMESTSTAFGGRLLGHVIAHELGHLLLGMNSHSRAGLMQGRWTDIELRQISMGRLGFDQGQSNIIKAHLLGPYAALRCSAGTARDVRVTRASLPPM